MADKDKTKTTTKKTYKKPSADRLGDSDLKDVAGGNGGAGSGGQDNPVFFCKLVGGLAATSCLSGAAAARRCDAGSTAARDCVAGDYPRR